MRASGVTCLLMLCACCFAGCGLDRPPLAPVTGRITLDGKPVEGASVLFHARDEQTRPGAGLTNKDGEFQVTTYTVGDGGMLGTHRVTVSKILNPMTPRERQLFPAKLADPETTDLKAVVSEQGENRFDFDIVAAKQ